MIARTRFALGLGLGVLACSCQREPVTPQQVLTRMTDAYSACRSYQEVGEFVQVFTALDASRSPVVSNAQPFSIQFQRPSLLQFEFFHQETLEDATAEDVRNMANWPRSKCVLWSDGQQARIYSEKTHTYWQGADLSNAIAQVSALSQKRGTAALGLLTQPGAFIQSYLQYMTSLRDSKLDGTQCYVLSGNVPGGPAKLELWIDKKNYFLRKRRMIVNAEGLSSVMDENHRDIRVNQSISPSVFTFRLPEDARQTTNALSLLPDLERITNSGTTAPVR